jgi:hypothetical protein
MEVAMFRVIIAGSRTIDAQTVSDIVNQLVNEVEPLKDLLWDNKDRLVYLSGGCQSGADQVPFLWRERGSDIQIELHLPEWGVHGRAAGPIRNRQMAEAADLLILVWDGKSAGSASMKAEMQALKKPVYEVVV